MKTELGLRERKKLETRHRLGDIAAALFAERGYDSVSMSDVARAANVADQTVYNYFPTKPELVLDRADEFLDEARRDVAERGPDETPADALRHVVLEDIARFRDAGVGAGDALERGQFPVLSLVSDSLRRYALEFRGRQARAIAQAIVGTDPSISFLVALAHATALVVVLQSTSDAIGAAIAAGEADRDAPADAMTADAEAALADAAANFRATQARAVQGWQATARTVEAPKNHAAG